MPCPPLPRHARTPTLPTTPSTCLLRRRARFPVRGSSGVAAATPLVAAVAPPDLTCSHYNSVAASPSQRTSSSTSRRGGGGGDLLVLAVTASAVAVSACLVFFSVIRSMLACKREAEFLEKYFDSARAKLPQTMASVRLVGREIGDLASDLSDLIQELTKGVTSSMRIVHAAEAQLHQITPSTRPESPRRMSNQKISVDEPLLAGTVRDLRQLIADIRSGFGAASSMTSAFMWASNFGSKRRKNRS